MTLATLYCDTRIGGIEQWVFGDPEESIMRVPDVLKQCVCFLCTKDRTGRMHYGGTGFFVSVESLDMPHIAYGYLVTARHCVQKAMETGSDLYVRMNTLTGGVDFVKI